MSRFLEEQPKGREGNLFSILPVPSWQNGIHGFWLRSRAYGDGGSTPAANGVLLGRSEGTRP